MPVKKTKKTNRKSTKKVTMHGEKTFTIHKGALHKHLKVPKSYKFRKSSIDRMAKIPLKKHFTFRTHKFIMTSKLKKEITLAKSFIKMRKNKKTKHKGGGVPIGGQQYILVVHQLHQICHLINFVSFQKLVNIYLKQHWHVLLLLFLQVVFNQIWIFLMHLLKESFNYSKYNDYYILMFQYHLG